MYVIGCYVSLRDFGQRLSIACYSVNTSLSTALNIKTLEKVWSRKAASNDNLRLIVGVAYAHVKQGKLEP